LAKQGRGTIRGKANHLGERHVEVDRSREARRFG
jgi:hypothetical protein